MQHSYFLENDEYQNFSALDFGNKCTNEDAEELGFEIQPCTKQVPRYAYSTTGADDASFDGLAQSKKSVCKNAVVHWFGIDENKSFLGPKSCRDGKIHTEMRVQLNQQTN